MESSGRQGVRSARQHTSSVRCTPNSRASAHPRHLACEPGGGEGDRHRQVHQGPGGDGHLRAIKHGTGGVVMSSSPGGLDIAQLLPALQPHAHPPLG